MCYIRAFHRSLELLIIIAQKKSLLFRYNVYTINYLRIIIQHRDKFNTVYVHSYYNIIIHICMYAPAAISISQLYNYYYCGVRVQENELYAECG